VKLNVYNRQEALSLSKPSARKVLRVLCNYLSIQGDELSIYFVSGQAIAQLHGQFFGDPTPTDCITFPLDKSYVGDLFISPEEALSYNPENPYSETQLYLVHGLLHLAGYDDLCPKARRAMRKMEKTCMDHLYKLGLTLTP